MTEAAKDMATQSAIALLTHYSFDLGANTAEQMVARWLNDYQAIWVFWAIIEALYQGRYKGVSVGQILACWKRRNQPLYHFNTEFERIVCRNFPYNLNAQDASSADAPSVPETVLSPNSLPWEGEREAPAPPTPSQTPPKSVGALPPGEPAMPLPVGTSRDSSLPSPPEPPPSAPAAPAAPETPGNAALESTARAAARDLLSQLAEQVDLDLDNPPPPGSTRGVKAILELVEAALANSAKEAKQAREAIAPPSEPAPETAPTPANPQQPPQAPAATGEKTKQVPRSKYQADWSRWDSIKQPIGSFSPPAQSSDFYDKLKSVAHPPQEPAAGESSEQPKAEDIEDLKKDLWSEE